jgi:hypothetical protein
VKKGFNKSNIFWQQENSLAPLLIVRLILSAAFKKIFYNKTINNSKAQAYGFKKVVCLPCMH